MRVREEKKAFFILQNKQQCSLLCSLLFTRILLVTIRMLKSKQSKKKFNTRADTRWLPYEIVKFVSCTCVLELEIIILGLYEQLFQNL